MSAIVSGNIVDVVNRRIFSGKITVDGGKITNIEKCETESSDFILPGLVDAHIHIESSMLTPSAFAAAAVKHGTVATVSDPHEIANVLGIEGVDFMIQNGKQVPFKFYFGAPSCVPATPFETSGAVLGEKEIEKLLASDDIVYLAEMMNFPGVIFEDKEVMKKLEHARKYGKPVDGHIPGIGGADLKKYASTGITTDHECFTIEEAIEKIGLGMKILIREGSAAKNFDDLITLVESHPDDIMFCSDDRHPDDLIEGHINELVVRAVDAGFDIYNVLRACTLNPKEHYGLSIGLLQEGDNADFIIINDLNTFSVKETWIDGEIVASEGSCKFKIPDTAKPNIFNLESVKIEDIQVIDEGGLVNVIEALDGQLITNKLQIKLPVSHGYVHADLEQDVLKIVVFNRYTESKASVGFIKNFGLKRGAMASTVAHDSHNLIVVGVNDDEIISAANEVIKHKGGLAVVDGNEKMILELPVAGLMTDSSAEHISNLYKKLDSKVKSIGSYLNAPFMTLSFMALLVIPAIKLGDKGLFDGTKFEFISNFEK